MSKTDKDKPYHIQVQEERSNYSWRHNQWNIGRKIRKTKYVTDENNNYVIEPYTYEETIYKEHPSFYINDFGYKILTGLTYEVPIKTVTRTGHRYATQQIVAKEYENFCTCGVSENFYGVIKGNGKIDPCYKTITTRSYYPYYGANPPHKNYGGDNSKTKTMLNKVKNSFNTNYDTFSEEDVEEKIYWFKPPIAAWND